MSGSDTAWALDSAARDWQSWLTSRGLDDPDAMTAHAVSDLVEGRTPPATGTRIYCALTTGGVAAYVGQTRRPLAERIGEHVRCGNAKDWAWVVSVSAAGLTAPELDRLERSAHLWMVPHSRRRFRKTPAAR